MPAAEKGVQRGWLREVQPLLVPLHEAEAPRPAPPHPTPPHPKPGVNGFSALLAFSIFYLDKRWDEVEGGGRIGLSLPFTSFRAWWALSRHWEAKSSGVQGRVRK